MQTTPINPKGFFVTEDIRLQNRIHQDACIAIDSYEYILNKSRQSNGTPLPVATSGSLLSVTMCIGSRNSMRPFYERMQDAQPTAYSVVFDARFDAAGMLDSYYSAFVLTGNVVGISEDYDLNPEAGHENLTITVQILISRLTVLGNTHDVTYK